MLRASNNPACTSQNEDGTEESTVVVKGDYLLIAQPPIPITYVFLLKDISHLSIFCQI